MDMPEHVDEAVLLVSFGGPERAEDVMPFLRRVTAGRGVPDDRLAQVAEHYYARGGVSPINAANRALRAALEAELSRRGDARPVLLGNRNAAPFLADALRHAHELGVHRLRVVLTSLFPSYSGCRQYRENLAVALAETGLDHALELILDEFVWDSEGFVAAQVDAVRNALDQLEPPDDTQAAGSHPADLVFVAHSIPVAMAESAGPAGHEYVGSLEAVARRVVAAVASAQPGRVGAWRIAYCSRSGAPGQPWLEPDVNDDLATLASANRRPVVLVPIGFVSDHMEVVHDLDTVAAQTAHSLGLPCARAATVDTDARFVAALADQIERPGRVCPPHCCPNLRQRTTPAACGATDSQRQAS